MILIKEDSKITFNSFDLVNSGVEVIKHGISSKNLDKFDRVKKIIIINDYLDSNRPDRDALSFIQDIYKVPIYHINRRVEHRFFNGALRVVADLRSIDIDILDEILIQNELDSKGNLYKDELEAIEAGSVEVAKRLLKVDSIDTYLDYFNSFRFILADYISVKNKSVITESQLNVALDDIDKFVKANSELSQSLEEMSEIKDSFKKEYSKAISSYKELRLKYLKDRNIGYYDLRQYDARPKVIAMYMRTYLNGVFDYLETLYQTIQNTLGESVKIIISAGGNFNNLSQLIPSSFKVYTESISSKELYNEDLIVKYGNINELLNVLLENKLNLSNLIIVNFTDSSMEFDGRYAEFDIVDSTATMDKLSLDPISTISVDNDLMRWDISTVENIVGEGIKTAILAKQSSVIEVIETVKQL